MSVRHAGDQATLAFSRPPSRRAIVLAHFDPQGRFDPHVMHAARAYRQLATRLVLVSNGGGRLPRDLAELVDDYLPRPNAGYDFGAWKDGLATLDRGGFDEVVCVNDSVYGPLFDLAPAFDHPRTAVADLWGMVLSEQPTGRDRPRVPHVQSWFFAMRRPLLESAWFDNFWSNGSRSGCRGLRLRRGSGSPGCTTPRPPHELPCERSCRTSRSLHPTGHGG